MIGDLVVATAIAAMALGSAYLIWRDKRRGAVCSGCGGSCGCGKGRAPANPINVSIDETSEPKNRS